MRRADTSVEQIIQAANIMPDLKDEVQEQVIETLLALMQRPDLSVGQIIQIAQSIYVPSHSEQEEHATTILLELMQRPDLSVEQAIQVAEVTRHVLTYEMDNPAIPILLELIQRTELSIEQVVQGKQALLELLKNAYGLENAYGYDEEYNNALGYLKRVGGDANIDSDLRLQALATVFITHSQYEEKVWATRMLLNLNQKEAVQHYLREKWRIIRYSNGIADIPFIADLAEQEILPLGVRNFMYRQLHNLLS
jgi:hypothetical protein